MAPKQVEPLQDWLQLVVEFPRPSAAAERGAILRVAKPAGGRQIYTSPGGAVRDQLLWPRMDDAVARMSRLAARTTRNGRNR